MPAEFQTERRAHRRFILPPMYSFVTVERQSEQRFEPLEGHLYDLSEGGSRIELDAPLDPGERVYLSLQLPGAADVVHARADVVWIAAVDDDPGPRRQAVRFVEFATDRDRALLYRMVNDLAQRQAA